MLFKHQVVSIKALNKKFYQIKLKALNPDFSFKVGQFVTVKVKNNTYRAYSFASSPSLLPVWEIFVDITPGGPGTTYLKGLKKGDLIKTSNPTGQFFLNKRFKYYLFGATGCGIAPFLAMIEELIKDKEKKIYLFWGLRHKEDIALTSWLNSLKPNFEYEIILSQPDSKWRGKSGYITFPILKRAKAFSPANTSIYLSGSNQFIKETNTALKEIKYPTQKIYFEACY